MGFENIGDEVVAGCLNLRYHNKFDNAACQRSLWLRFFFFFSVDVSQLF